MKILLLIAIIISFSFSVPDYIVKMRQLDLIENQQMIQQHQQSLEKAKQKIVTDFLEWESKEELKRKNTL